MNLNRILFVSGSSQAEGGKQQVGPLEASFRVLSEDLWRRTASTRPTLLRYGGDGLPAEMYEATIATIILDVTGDLALPARKLWTTHADLRSKIWLYSASGSRRPFTNGAPAPSSLDEIRQRLVAAFPKQTQFGKIAWDEGDPDLELLCARLEPHIYLLLEKFFPGRKQPARIHKVGGGMSGTTLLRLSVDGEIQEYFIKLFSDIDEFRLEWNSHESARQWLSTHVVPLHGIPSVREDSESQLAAFPRSASWQPNQEAFYPICYKAAPNSTTFKDLYESENETFLTSALRDMLDVLQPRWTDGMPPPIALTGLEDCGPGRWKRPKDQRIMESLRSPHYRSFFKGTIRLFSGYWSKLCEHFQGLNLDELNNFLSADQPWVSEKVPILKGPIHGDANSRNFILPRASPTVATIQIIDCGGYNPDAPRLFDLAQMETDLKILLLATEAGASGFRDIDTSQLVDWCRQEEQVLSRLGPSQVPDDSSPSTKRAYSLVNTIRQRAVELSPGDPEGRTYFFLLLYWTMRKLRHADFPHAKRLLALFSLCTICGYMKEWKKP